MYSISRVTNYRQISARSTLEEAHDERAHPSAAQRRKEAIAAARGRGGRRTPTYLEHADYHARHEVQNPIKCINVWNNRLKK